MNIFSVKIENLDMIPNTLLHIPDFFKYNKKMTSRVLNSGVIYDVSSDLYYIDIDYPFTKSPSRDNIRGLIKEIKTLNRSNVINEILS